MKKTCLSWFFAGIAVLLSPAFSGRVAAESPSFQGPARPLNPADAVPYPTDRSRCETGPEKAWKLVVVVSNNCTAHVAEKGGDYAVIVAHFAWSWWVPGMSEIVLGELIKKLGKDAAVCVLSGLVQGGGGTPQQKAVAKAAIQEIQELIDRNKFYKTGSPTVAHLAEFGRENILADEDRKKFVLYAGKKLYDRVKNVAPEDAGGESREETLLKALLAWMDTPERRQKKALAEADDSVNHCAFDQANEQIAAAQFQNVDILRQLRQAIGAKTKDLRCNHEARVQLVGPQSGTYTVQQALSQLSEERAQAEFDLEQLKRADTEQTGYMQELADLAGNMQAKRDELERKLRQPFNEAAGRAQAALDSCNYQQAEGIIGGLKQYTTTSYCAEAMKHEYMRELELANSLQALKDKQATNVEKIEEVYQKALALPKDKNCSAILDEADFLGKLVKGLCINMADAEAKIANLKKTADECSKTAAKSASGALKLVKKEVRDKIHGLFAPGGHEQGHDDYTFTETSAQVDHLRLDNDGKLYEHIATAWNFAGIPESLNPGDRFTITIKGQTSKDGPSGNAWELEALVRQSGLTQTAGKAVYMGDWGAGFVSGVEGAFSFEVPKDASAVTISLCGNMGVNVIAEYTYGRTTTTETTATSTATTTTSTTTTTLFPPCTQQGAQCGSCPGGGFCRPLCANGCALACTTNVGSAAPCVTDDDCHHPPYGLGPNAFCAPLGLSAACPAGCQTGGFNNCVNPCP